MTGIIVKSKIREIVKELDSEKIINNVSEEFEEALEKRVREELKKSIDRAKANQRRTLFSRDL